jgi:transposase
MGQITLISGRERRRHWSSEDRARILAAIEAPGAVVAEVARREDVCTSLLYKWRREARRVEKMTAFAPVVVEPASASPPAPPSRGDTESCVITVEMNAVRIRIFADAPPASIAATLKALRL